VSDSRTTSSRRPELLAVAASLPPAVAQGEVAAFTASRFPDIDPARVRAVFEHTAIEQRHLARPLSWYADRQSPGVRFRIANDLALEHGSFAARQVMARADVDPKDIDTLVFVSTTVLRSPNLDVSLASTLGLRRDVRRIPMFGLASLGGAAALGLAADLVRGGDRTVLVIASEMNSLTFVPGDASMESLVTMALFSDGAAAAIVRSAQDATSDDEPTDDASVKLVARHSTIVPDTLDVMGFDATDEGLHWRLAPDVPDVALTWTRASVEDALAVVGWKLGDLDHVLVHPGGPKVLDAVERAVGWDPGHLEWSRIAMRDHGNVSSVTVLLVLEAFVASAPAPGRGLVTAMGPGFSFEHILFAVGRGFAPGPERPVP
jgi:alkylresorcinol/alkylpyrone synthase